MKLKHMLGAVFAAIFALAFCLSLIGCGGTHNWTDGKDTPESNPLRDFAEVVEFNKNSVLPELMGTPRPELGNGYELRSGVANHIETYLSSDNIDVAYTLGTREMHYSGGKAADELYVTGIRVRAMEKTYSTVNGQSVANYVTSRSFLGVQVGNNYEDADAAFLSFGYSKIYEEPAQTTGLPNSREITYRKGIVVISIAVERNGEISSMYAWIPYDTSEIEALLASSHLPAMLGSVYNCYGSTDPIFTYSSKNADATARIYEADDGSTAVMRGYPDSSDFIMFADLTFSDPKYDVDGARIGETFRECIDKLVAAGWTLQKDSSTLTKGELTLRLFDYIPEPTGDAPMVIGTDDKIVNCIRISLPDSSQMDKLAVID